MTIEEGDTVRIGYVGRLEDGTIFDTSDKVLAETSGLIGEDPNRDYTPLRVEVGEDSVIPGVQEALIGMEEGEEKTVTVPPEKGYGQHTEDRVAEYDRTNFEEMLGKEATVGTEVQTEEGLPGEVIELDEETAVVDFNHELAGKTLEFELEVLEVK